MARDSGRDARTVGAELRAALAEQAELTRRIEALRVEQTRLLQRRRRQDLSDMTKGEAIIAVLREAGRPLGPSKIHQALLSGNRPHESYNGVSGELRNMLARGRLMQPAPGVYVTVDND